MNKNKYIGDYAGEVISKIKAEALALIGENDLWGLTDLHAQQACAFIDGVNSLAQRLIALIEAESEKE